MSEIDNRPANCRNRLRDEGKAYPKSGCQVCRAGGMTGCPYEISATAAAPAAFEAPVINKIERWEVDGFKSLVGSDIIFNAMDDYQRIATKSAIYPGQGTPIGLSYVAHKIAGEAGEFNEHFGKAMRDDGYGMPVPRKFNEEVVVVYPVDLTPDRRDKLEKEIGDILWYLSAACNELGTTLSDIAAKNLDKLCSRTERDQLRGAGDNR